MKPRTPFRPLLLLFFTAALVVATVKLLTVSRPVNVCVKLRWAHRQLLHDVHSLPRNGSLANISSERYFHDRVRKSATVFLSYASLRQAKHCRRIRPRRRKVEFQIAHSPLEPLLLYLLSITGARKKIIVSVESAWGTGHLIGALPALLHGYKVLTICEKWTGFEATRKYYEGKKVDSRVVDASSRAEVQRNSAHQGFPVDSVSVKNDVAGVIDALALFPGRGAELAYMKRLRYSSLRPRLLAVFYQAYWGMAARMRTGDGKMDKDGRERFFVGGSLPALVILARMSGYRLVWCAKSLPVAFFVDESEQGAPELLATMRVEMCFGRDLKWHRDAEAMWDIAQTYAWKTVE